MRRRDAREERAARASAERVLEQKRQLGIAVGHVSFLAVSHVHEGFDDVPERAERFINRARLFQTFTCRVRALLPLAPCEIDQVQKRALFCRRRRGMRLRARFHRNREHAVRTRRIGIHIRLTHPTIRRPAQKRLVRLLRPVHALLVQILHEGASLGVFPHVRRRSIVLGAHQ